MPKISSDLTNRNFTSSAREFEVSDESDFDYNQSSQNYLADNAELNAINERLKARNLPPLDTNGVKALEARQAMQSEKFNEDPPAVNREAQIMAARRAKATGKERLSEGARRRIEVLVGMLNLTKEVKVGEVTFVIKNLNGKEIREVLKNAALYDGTVEMPYESRKQFLAYAITEIAGNDIASFLGDDSMEARIEFIDELSDPVLNKLYAEYLKLAQEAKEKYQINTAVQAEELVEDLKK